MTIFMGVVLILGVVLWRVDLSWEWDIPQKWQAKIGTWKESLVSRTHILNYDWYLGLEQPREWEKHLWQLQMEFPRLRRKFSAPIRLEICVHPQDTVSQNDTYISCLQSRFPGIGFYESPLCSETGDEGKDCGVEQK